MLEECDHVLEVKGLDEWFSVSNSQEIAPKKCPKCNTLINLTFRYATACKRAYKNIMQVKKKIFGTNKETENQRKILIENVDVLLNNSFGFIKKSRAWKKLINHVKEKIQWVFKKRKQNLSLPQIHKYKRIYDAMLRIFFAYDKLKDLNDVNEFMKHSDFLLESLFEVDNISDQYVDDIQQELSRLHWICEFCLIIAKDEYKANKSDMKVQKLYDECLKNIMHIKRFTESNVILAEMLLGDLLKAAKSSATITREDKQMIMAAMGFAKQGHWYACPNNHVYCITECGGAMEESKCPDCGCKIGGASHRLLVTNRVATEMDGATRPAFS